MKEYERLRKISSVHTTIEGDFRILPGLRHAPQSSTSRHRYRAAFLSLHLRHQDPGSERAGRGLRRPPIGRSLPRRTRCTLRAARPRWYAPLDNQAARPPRARRRSRDRNLHRHQGHGRPDHHIPGDCNAALGWCECRWCPRDTAAGRWALSTLSSGTGPGGCSQATRHDRPPRCRRDYSRPRRCICRDLWKARPGTRRCERLAGVPDRTRCPDSGAISPRIRLRATPPFRRGPRRPVVRGPRPARPLRGGHGRPGRHRPA